VRYSVPFEEVGIEECFLAAKPKARDDFLCLAQPMSSKVFDSFFVVELHRHDNRVLMMDELLKMSQGIFYVILVAPNFAKCCLDRR
jgi:hypothetical protein